MRSDCNGILNPNDPTTDLSLDAQRWPHPSLIDGEFDDQPDRLDGGFLRYEVGVTERTA